MVTSVWSLHWSAGQARPWCARCHHSPLLTTLGSLCLSPCLPRAELTAPVSVLVDTCHTCHQSTGVSRASAPDQLVLPHLDISHHSRHKVDEVGEPDERPPPIPRLDGRLLLPDARPPPLGDGGAQGPQDPAGDEGGHGGRGGQ